MILAADQFEFIRRIVNDEAGQALEPDQQLFAERRLSAVAERHGWTQLQTLIDRLRDPLNRILVQEVIESLATHETSFFRDPHCFEELIDGTLRRLFATRSSERRLAIWCAACATGQEAYSVAMILRERFPETLQDWKIDLIASDLSSIALQQAQSGKYTDVEVRRGLSDARLAQHFRRDAGGWQIDDKLRQMIRFQQCNLIGHWSMLPSLDLVLMRNVMIYMSPSARQTILTRLQKVIQPDGFLMLGSTESVNLPNLQLARVAFK